MDDKPSLSIQELSLPAGGVTLVYLFRKPRGPLGRRKVRLRTDVSPPRPQILSSSCLLLPLSKGWTAEVEDPWLVLWARLLPLFWALLASEGSLWIHAFPGDVHYLKVLADGVLGRRAFWNEIVWAHEPQWKERRRWPEGHQLLLGYARSPRHVLFRKEVMDRIPYMAPRLVGEEKARRGKRPTDVWWFAHLDPPASGQGEGDSFPPESFWRRLLKVHTRPGDVVLALGAPSSLVAAAVDLGRRCFLLPEDAMAETMALEGEG